MASVTPWFTPVMTAKLRAEPQGPPACICAICFAISAFTQVSSELLLPRGATNKIWCISEHCMSSCRFDSQSAGLGSDRSFVPRIDETRRLKWPNKAAVKTAMQAFSPGLLPCIEDICWGFMLVNCPMTRPITPPWTWIQGRTHLICENIGLGAEQDLNWFNRRLTCSAPRAVVARTWAAAGCLLIQSPYAGPQLAGSLTLNCCEAPSVIAALSGPEQRRLCLNLKQPQNSFS